MEAGPKCVGIIMDGNRRWAKGKDLPTLEGHRRGYEKLKDVFSWSRDCGVSHVVVYAFSTENWKREITEVSYLMDLFRTMLKKDIREVQKTGSVNFVGDLSRLPEDLQEDIRILEGTPSVADHSLWVALSYGGRAEIFSAAKRFSEQSERERKNATVDDFAKLLWTYPMPEPDIIIRTGGEKRLSNFLPWQSVYSELFFTDTYWPDFSKQEFLQILEDYKSRVRRKGK